MRQQSIHVDTASEEFQANYAHHDQLRDEFRQRLADVVQGGPSAVRRRHIDSGRLLPRQRVQRLLDAGSPFLEIGALAAFGLYSDEAPSAGLITGIGLVAGRYVMIVCNDSTVKGGTYYPMTVKKHLRAQEIALENRLPCLYLVDSGGAFLPHQDEVFPDRDHFGRIFYHQAQLSAQGIPQISAVFGSSTAGGAYVPAMSDESIMVRNQGTIFLGGPPLVQAATGEVVTAQELGGADVHTAISGVADHMAEDDDHALHMLRKIVETLPHNPPRVWDRAEDTAPAFPSEELLGIVPSDPHTSYDVRKIIHRIVDHHSFHEFKANYGTTLVTGFARINGHTVGIIANNGILFSESSLKGAHFIELADQRGIPLVFLQNVSGFMVGKDYEAGGIAKHGAKMVTAVATTRVPKITIMIGGSFGAGNYSMAGRAFSPRFVFMWPNARISVMGPEQAAGVLATVKRQQHERKGTAWSPEQEQLFKQPILDQYNEQGSAYYSTARLWDDGIIEPQDTRRVVSMALDLCSRVPLPEPQFGLFRM